MDGIRIRKGTHRDFAELAELQRRSMQTVAAGHYSKAQIAAFLAVATPDLEGVLQSATVFLAHSDGQLIASAAWHFEGALSTLNHDAPFDPGVAVFRTVYVDPGWTRRGLASMLMDRAEADAASSGAAMAKLHAMLSALAFYQARGYEPVGQAVFDLAGVPFPGVAMTRALPERAARAA